jgi:cytochrome c-type biogenesis protein CcmE
MAQTLNQAATIPSDLAARSNANKNLKFIIGGLLLLGVVAALIIQATISTGAYYMTVSELNVAGPQLVGERVRVNGNVVDGSEDWNAREITLRFSITDESGQQLPIVFYGPRPDNFQRAASAIVEGQLLADGSFQADSLLLKCPSRYEEEPEEVYVESTR